MTTKTEKENQIVVVRTGIISQNPEKFPVPEGQEWLFAMLEKQYNLLSSVKTILAWILFLTILSAIFGGCVALNLS